MNKIWTLTKVLLKLNYADIITDKKKRWAYVFSFVALLFAGFIFIGPLTYGMYVQMKAFGQETLSLGMGLAVASIWVFVISITNILTVFYYNNDVETLLPLPLQPAQIITAKFITVLIAQYVMASFILFPIFIVYGIQSGAFITYYVYVLIIYIFFPIIPLVLASLLMTLLMRYTNVAKNKDRGNIFIGLVTLLLIVGINIFMQWRNKNVASEDMVANYFAEHQSSLLVQITNYFPTTYFGAMGLIENASWQGIVYVFLFAVISFSFFRVVFLCCTTYIFKRSYRAFNQYGKKRTYFGRKF